MHARHILQVFVHLCRLEAALKGQAEWGRGGSSRTDWDWVVWEWDHWALVSSLSLCLWMAMNLALTVHFCSKWKDWAFLLELTSYGCVRRRASFRANRLNSVWHLLSCPCGEAGQVAGTVGVVDGEGLIFHQSSWECFVLKQCLSSRVGPARAQAVLAVQVVDRLLHGISWVMVFNLFGNSSCFFPSFLSFVFPASSAPRIISPSGENQEAIRKLGTISSSISPKELQEEAFGRKDVNVDKNLGGS